MLLRKEYFENGLEVIFCQRIFKQTEKNYIGND